MSRFYASIKGNRGEATRCGAASSGMVGHIRGWNIGVKVYLLTDPDNPDKDQVVVYRTGGSNGFMSSKLIASFTEED